MAKRQKSTAAILKGFLERDARMQGVKQSFIIAALDTYARRIICEDDWNPMSGIVTDELWREIARELKDEIHLHYGKESDSIAA